MKQALDAQDGLYTLILKHSDGTWEPRAIGSIVQYLFAPDDPEAVIEKMAAVSMRIVFLTITDHRRGAGRSQGAVRHRRPMAGSLRAVHAVGAPARLHGRPSVVRRRRGTVRGQRRAERTAEVAAAEQQSPGPVLFRPPGRLPAGARGRPGSPVPGFLLGYMDEQAILTLPPVHGVNLEEYTHTLIERFSNPQVHDTIARLCVEGPDRIPKWLVPVIGQQLATGGEIRRSAAVVASWARYAEGVDEQGQPIEVVDRLADRLTRAARRQYANPTAFIADRDLFGDLAGHERFVTAYRSALTSLHERGHG